MTNFPLTDTDFGADFCPLKTKIARFSLGFRLSTDMPYGFSYLYTY